MNKEEATSKAADWWTEMVFSGHWNNGDAPTENMNAFMKQLMPGPVPKEATLVRKAFLSLLEKITDLYCDYGNSNIDAAFKEQGLPYHSNVHCPQKAGTRIFEENGEWFVETKSGYGQPYVRI